MQAVLHLEQLLALALEHLLHRDAGPAGDHGGDLFGVDDLWCELVLRSLLGLSQAFLHQGNLAVHDLRRLLQVAGALGLGQLGAQAIERLADLGGRAELVLLGLPAGGHLLRLDLQVGELAFERIQPPP